MCLKAHIATGAKESFVKIKYAFCEYSEFLSRKVKSNKILSKVKASKMLFI